jgi:hypothetical protein
LHNAAGNPLGDERGVVTDTSFAPEFPAPTALDAAGEWRRRGHQHELV